MLAQFTQSQQQWGGANKTIDNWLQERQAVLVSYCELAGLPPFEQAENTLPCTLNIKRFCQVLMDYVSAGHFEIFDAIVEKCKINGQESADKAQKLYPKINNSTDFALQFNDKFAELESLKTSNSFAQSFSRLGKHIEERFSFEDQLIANLYDNHS
jgi:regulator of sigma D